MSSLGHQQESIRRSAEASEKLVEALLEHTSELKKQTKANQKTQFTMLVATIVMAIASLLELIA